MVHLFYVFQGGFFITGRVEARSQRPNGRIAYGSRTNPDFCASFTRFGGVLRGCALETC